MPTRQLFLVRTALMAGVAAFAGIVAFQRAQGSLGPDSFPLPLDQARYALWALAALSLAAALFLRSRLEGVSEKQRGLHLVIGWAFGEGVALFGIIQYFLGAPVSAMAVGLLAFIAALMVLPIPRAR